MIFTRPGFERRYKKLSPGERERVNEAIKRFSASIGNPHGHTWTGLRAFGRYLEFRAGLGLRILALPDGDDYFLMCVGNHDEIRAYVKNSP
jgi:hypothetical protein